MNPTPIWRTIGAVQRSEKLHVRFCSLKIFNLAVLILAACSFASAASAQTQPPPNPEPPKSAKLASVDITGTTKFSGEQVEAQCGLKLGEIVDKDQLQSAATRLGNSGLYTKVNYSYKTDTAGVHVTFDLADVPGVPVLFDNFPWFTDDELAGALRQAIGTFDGTAPQEGPALDTMARAIVNFLPTKGIHGQVTHELLQLPDGSREVMQFSLVGNPVFIQSMEFSDPLPLKDVHVTAQMSDIVGHPFSRFEVATYAFEEIRPVYLSAGYLKASFATPVITMLPPKTNGGPDAARVTLPITLGAQYHLGGITWTGNGAYSDISLNSMIPVKPGDIADGNKIQFAFGDIAGSYAHIGYLDAHLDPQPEFDDAAGKVSYHVTVTEGGQYKMGNLVITGLSIDGEKKLRQAWVLATGAVFDQTYYEDFLRRIAKPTAAIYGSLPVHYDTVGRLLRRNEQAHTVDVLLDFQ
jgi:outer membrane protein assembly factor BamA